jgi:hypothetical protein
MAEKQQQRPRAEFVRPHERDMQPPPDAGPVVASNGGGEPQIDSSRDWPMRVKLSKPIRNKDGNFVEEIEFREPTTGDLIAVGDPYSLNMETGMLIFDPKNMAPLMSRLSLTPMAFLQQMSISDYETCKLALARFFLPDLTRVVSRPTATD